MKKRPNILFIVVDALRTDRMSTFGYERATTPHIDRCAENSLVFSQNICNAAFTQASYHSFMTSSRPLSFGGYDDGAFNRPDTVFAAFHKSGYHVYPISTTQWITPLMGYSKGMDNACYLFVINTLVGVAAVTLREHIASYAAGDISAHKLATIAQPLLIRLFQNIEDYCDVMEADSTISIDFSESRLVNDRYDYKRIRQLIGRHRSAFEAAPDVYVATHFQKPFAAHNWIAHEWRMYRDIGKLVLESAGVITNRIISLFDRQHASLRAMKFKRYVDASDLADRVIKTMHAWQTNHDDKPFLIWTHLFDTHVPYCAGHGRQWYRQTPSYLKRLGYGLEIDISSAVVRKPATSKQWSEWSALYDAAVCYVDEQIGKILSALDSMGLSDNTLVVITSDHGEELGEHGDISHHFRFYEHNVRVPLLFSGPEIAAYESDALVTLLDLAPSMATFANVPVDPLWEGAPVTESSISSREYALMESFHGGACLFDTRPPYFAIRNRTTKYMWREHRDASDKFSPEIPELYDLQKDPNELVNLYQKNDPKLVDFNALIRKRMDEIPEFGPGKTRPGTPQSA